MSILDDLQSVADAIRSKTGKTDKMMLAEMPGEIEKWWGRLSTSTFIYLCVSGDCI